MSSIFTHTPANSDSSCRTIIGLDRVPSRLALAKELGATHTIDGSQLGSQSLLSAIHALTDNIGPTVTIDTTGVPALTKAGVEFTRNRGKFIQVGSSPFDFNLDINVFTFMVSGKQFIGAVEGQAYPPEYVPKMVQWYREGRFPIDKLMKLMPAEDFEQGLKEMHGKWIEVHDACLVSGLITRFCFRRYYDQADSVLVVRHFDRFLSLDV